MMYDTLNVKEPGTVVFLTGDGAGWRYRKRFLPTLQSMKKHHWKIEMISWEMSCNQWLKEWVLQNGLFVRLDDFYKSITYIRKVLRKLT